jgi:hypothetical protein
MSAIQHHNLLDYHRIQALLQLKGKAKMLIRIEEAEIWFYLLHVLKTRFYHRSSSLSARKNFCDQIQAYLLGFVNNRRNHGSYQ